MDTRIMNDAEKFGCAICYGRIKKNEKVLVCQEPCNKIFHPECFYKSTEETGLFHIKCCYCKRKLVTEENLFDVENTFICQLIRHRSGCNSRYGYTMIYVEFKGQNILNIETYTQIIYPSKPEDTFKRPKRGACPRDPPRRTFYKGGGRGRTHKGCRGRA